MDYIFDLLGVVLLSILGGVAFYFFKSGGKKPGPSVNLPTPPDQEELGKIREDKKNELCKEDPSTFIDNHLDNADDVNDIKRTSDAEFDSIFNKHRDNLDR